MAKKNAPLTPSSTFAARLGSAQSGRLRSVALSAILSVTLAACWATRPPTTAVEVVGAAPDGTMKVGGPLPMWVDDNPECLSPPREVRMQAMQVGADFIVPDASKATNVWNGKSKGVCRAQGYAVVPAP